MRKLQINDAGAWRQILTYKDKRDVVVRKSAVALITIANPAAKLRTVDAETGAVLLYWDAQVGWHKPAFILRKQVT